MKVHTNPEVDFSFRTRNSGFFNEPLVSGCHLLRTRQSEAFGRISCIFSVKANSRILRSIPRARATKWLHGGGGVWVFSAVSTPFFALRPVERQVPGFSGVLGALDGRQLMAIEGSLHN